MARIRSVKPALRTSRVVASWPWPVRYFWVLLWGYLDDHGRNTTIWPDQTYRFVRRTRCFDVDSYEVKA